MFFASLRPDLILAGALLLGASSCAQQAEEKSTSNAKKKADDSKRASAKANEDDGEETNSETKGGKSATKSEETPAEPRGKQRIEFAGSKGDKVPGYLWLPAVAAGKKSPAILLMYGISDDKDSGTIAAAAEELAKKGFVSLTIDWPGTGDRGSISKQDRILDASVKDWTVADYAKAVSFLAQRPEVDASRIAYVGASMGAMTGLVYAAKDPRVKAVVAIVPIPNPLWGGDAPESAIRAVAPRPVLCLSTQDNSDLSGLVCQNNAGENRTLAGGHELEGMRGQVVELTEAFLKKSLRP